MNLRDRIIVGCLALVAATAGFWFLALKPKHAAAVAAGARVEQAQAQLDAARDALNSAKAARASYAADYATIARLGKAVPDDDDAASVVYQIAAAAKKAHIDFRSLAVGGGSTAQAPGTGATVLPPGVQAGTTDLNKLPFTFTFDGDYFALTKLLALLRSFTTVDGDALTVRGRLLTVEGVKLEESRKGFPMVKATIAATAYLTTTKVVLPGGTTAAPTTPTTPATTTAPATQAAENHTAAPAATLIPGAVR